MHKFNKQFTHISQVWFREKVTPLCHVVTFLQVAEGVLELLFSLMSFILVDAYCMIQENLIKLQLTSQN